MKTEKFTRNDNSEGITNVPEVGDRFYSRFSKVRTFKGGAYENHSLGVSKTDSEDAEVFYVKITNGQKKSLDLKGDINGKWLTFEEYSNDFGKQVGVREEE